MAPKLCKSAIPPGGRNFSACLLPSKRIHGLSYSSRCSSRATTSIHGVRSLFLTYLLPPDSIFFVEFNDYNGALFTIRARGLNNFVYWTSQIFGSLLIGYFILDKKSLRRRSRAFLGWIIVFVMVFVVHTWAYFYQK